MTKINPEGSCRSKYSFPKRAKLFNRDLADLLSSISQSGLHAPLVVNKTAHNIFDLIDGHRRYLCCEKLEFKEVGCLVYHNLSKGEVEYLRFNIQNIRKGWKPLEKADSIGRIQRAFKITSERELAELTNTSRTSVHNALAILDAGLQGYQSMSKYNMEQTYCDEYLSLRPHLRKVKSIQPTQMDDLLLGKVENKVIKKAKDFRRIKKVFRRANTHQDELYEFLMNPDMTVDELSERAEMTGFLYELEKASDKIKERLENGRGFSEKEFAQIRSLKELTDQVLVEAA